jgi:predicted RNA-binding Zn ribbon-like protein
MSSPPDTPTEIVSALSEGLCLDFANTRYWRGRHEPAERLHGWTDVLAWCVAAGILPARLDQAEKNRKNSQLFDEAMALRETVYALCASLAADKAPRESEIVALDAALAAAPPRRELKRLAAGKGFGWVRPQGTRAVDLLAPVLWSAGDLVAGPHLDRLRRCANDECLWLFLDDSKSGNRRWCAMSACGNRAKARRFYERQKSG